MRPADKLRNVGPKGAAWLRQVGLRTREDLQAAGALDAFMRVKRAGFKPSMNLLYALEGALLDCHWQEVPQARREQLVAEAEAAIGQLPPPRGRPVAAPVTTTIMQDDSSADGSGSMPSFLDPSDDGGGSDDHDNDR